MCDLMRLAVQTFEMFGPDATAAELGPAAAADEFGLAATAAESNAAGMIVTEPRGAQ